MEIKIKDKIMTITSESGIFCFGRCWLDKTKLGWIWYPREGEMKFKKFSFINLRIF